MARNLKRRNWTAAAAAFILVTTTLVATSFRGGAANAASGSDLIEYVQTTGANGTYIQYVPGDGSAPTNESVTSGGGCATPAPSGIPLLQLSASYYPDYSTNPNPTGYSGPSTPAVVGAYKARTGVCQIPPAWGIEQGEALMFSVGTNALVKGRLFSAASIDLVGNDKSGSATQGLLIETLAGKFVAQQSFSSVLPQGTAFTVTTPNSVAGGFDQIEIETLSPSTGSLSVVGPTSTFTLGAAHVTLTKTDNLHTYNAPGQIVTYTVTATNDGYEPLSNVTVTDVPTLDGFSCSPSGSVLAVGASVVCTGTHTITLDDFFGAGSFSDTATANGTSPLGQTVTASAGDTISAQVYPLCGGQTITSTAAATGTLPEGVTAQITMQGSPENCKTYTFFQASTNDFVTSPEDGKSIIFDSASVGGDQVTATFNWGLVPECRPDSGGSVTTIPICPVTTISFDNGATYQAQTYCAGASPPASPAWCTTSKDFADVVVNGVTYTHITETWLGTGDPRVSK